MSVISIMTALALSSRFYKLSVPAYVCWDETHFGKMAGQYLNRTYFVDVHPPLGKMLIALAGHMTGYDGKFDFALPGDEFVLEGDGVTYYYGMRGFSAIMGSLVVPLVYGSVKTMTRSKHAAIITSFLLIFDCGLITLSQYILLDPILLFFMTATIFFTVKFTSLNRSTGGLSTSANGANEFSYSWWCYLFMSGLSLGCMVAVKWIGLFTVVFVGIWTINNLWTLLSCMQVTMPVFMKHFVARAVCLIALPFAVYCGIFAVHYEILENSGMVDGHHSSMFQSCLKGNELHNASLPLHVAYGSIVTLKHHRITASGYLHSHDKAYPPAVMPFPNQQVTLYFHKDDNNFWEILKPSKYELENANLPNRALNQKKETETTKVERLKDRDIVRFRHVLTGHHLYSHPRSAPLSPRQQIVSGNNYSSVEERLNELWRLEIVGGAGNEGNGIHILKTILRFVHVKTGCVLLTSTKMLPKWGDGQYEVMCSHHRRHKNHAFWNLEYHVNTHMVGSRIEPCGIPFMHRLIESHLVMATFNSGLKPEEGERTSKPWHWPINYKGQHFSRMGESDLRIYLLGNPLIYLLNLLGIILFCFSAFAYRILELRNLPDVSPIQPKPRTHSPAAGVVTQRSRSSIYDSKAIELMAQNFAACRWFLIAWALHYVPFYFMSRILYFHHYYPAFIFSCCLTGCFVDLVFQASSVHLSHVFGRIMFFSSPQRVNNGLLFLFVTSVLQSFYLYSPLCYGMTGPYSHDEGSTMGGLKIFSQWEI